MPRRHAQKGFSGAVVIIAVILIGLAVLLARGLSRTEVGLGQEATTDTRMRLVSQSLATFTAANGRLPCPAFGTDDSGDERVGATASDCHVDGLVLPWRTLGLKREDSLDGWGRKISYRVYAGPTGFTTAGSLNLVNCNGNPGAVGVLAMDPGSRCNASHTNLPSAFAFARTPMLQVNDRGTVKRDLAYVLISHGDSGRGAFAADGGTRLEMPAAGGAEITNTQSASPYRIEQRSAVGVAANDAAHFDDVVLYKPLLELANEARLAGRDWGIDPGNFTASRQSFTRSAVEAAGGSLANSNTNQASLTFNAGTSAEVQVFAFGGTAQNISTGGATGEGIGTIETGGSASSSASISSDGGEALVLFTPASRGRYFGVRLFDFGTVAGVAERVRFTFVQAFPLAVIHTTEKLACQTDPARANLSAIDPGDEFDIVVIEPITRVGGTGPTELFLGTFSYCNTTQPLCRAPGADPADDCP